MKMMMSTTRATPTPASRSPKVTARLGQRHLTRSPLWRRSVPVLAAHAATPIRGPMGRGMQAAAGSR